MHDIINEINSISEIYEDDEVFKRIKKYIDRELEDRRLSVLLFDLIEESESDGDDISMLLAILESEIEAYFSRKPSIKI